jgi:hypothetical protein
MQDIIRLIKEFLSSELDVDTFCSEYERLYNFELDSSSTSKELRISLEKLFDIVVMYSPFEGDRAAIPNYVDERAVRSEVNAIVSDNYALFLSN